MGQADTMFLVVASFSMVLIGGIVAVAGSRRDRWNVTRSEWVGGGLLTCGLMLIGIGIEVSFC